LRDFEEKEITGKAVEVTVNNKKENSCLDFVQEFGLCKGGESKEGGKRD
jgi:hypothetical protein